MEGGELGESVEQLVTLAKNGNCDAFCSLIRQTEPAALSVAYGVLGDSSLAGDVVQDAFLQAWNKLGSLRETSRFLPWLLQMVRNRAIDRARLKSVSQLDPAIDAISHAPLPQDALEARELENRIEAGLSRLDEATRLAVVMRYFENLTSKEIAERLALSPAAIDMRLSRAREQLRDILSDLAVR